MPMILVDSLAIVPSEGIISYKVMHMNMIFINKKIDMNKKYMLAMKPNDIIGRYGLFFV